MQQFGEFVKMIRFNKQITLREFCRRISIDSGSWSKVERGLKPPPKSRKLLEEIAIALEIDRDSESYLSLFDIAAFSFIPEEISDERIIANLPAFARAIRGKPTSEDELEKLIEAIRRSNSYDNITENKKD